MSNILRRHFRLEGERRRLLNQQSIWDVIQNQPRRLLFTHLPHAAIHFLLMQTQQLLLLLLLLLNMESVQPVQHEGEPVEPNCGFVTEVNTIIKNSSKETKQSVWLNKTICSIFCGSVLSIAASSGTSAQLLLPASRCCVGTFLPLRTAWNQITVAHDMFGKRPSSVCLLH